MEKIEDLRELNSQSCQAPHVYRFLLGKSSCFTVRKELVARVRGYFPLGPGWGRRWSGRIRSVYICWVYAMTKLASMSRMRGLKTVKVAVEDESSVEI